jgi:hypothetical protein
MDDLNNEGLDSKDQDMDNQDSGYEGDNDSDQGSDDAKEDFSEREKGLYARLKKEEAKRKELEQLVGGVKKEAPKAEVKTNAKEPDTSDISKYVRQVLDEEYLADQNLPDTIKQKAKTVAQIEGISIKQALKHNYISAEIEEYNRANNVANAAAGGSKRGGSSTSFDPETPPDVDVSTPEGQKAIEEWENKLEKLRSAK